MFSLHGVLLEKFEGYFWKNEYPRRAVKQLRGKKVKHSLEIIAALAILGPSTTREMAKFTLSYSSDYSHKGMPGNKEASNLEKTYNRLIRDRPFKTLGRETGKYLGLITQGFLRATEKKKNEKGNEVARYFLTLKGCFFALGFQFQFTDRHLTSLIKNASRNHLYFAYLNNNLEDTSIDFIKKAYLDPIFSLIIKGVIILDSGVPFSYVTSEQQQAISKMIYDIINRHYGSSKQRSENELDLINFEKTLKHTFYTQNPTSDWRDSMRDYFYPDDSNLEYFDDYSDGSIEIQILYGIMRATHFGVYSGIHENIPNQTQKIPYSKDWKKYRKYHPEFKSPRDRDEKQNIVIHY